VSNHLNVGKRKLFLTEAGSGGVRSSQRGTLITGHRLISEVLVLFYLFYLIAMHPSLKPTDKYNYGYHPEHSN
jgi:hypothetical protein